MSGDVPKITDPPAPPNEGPADNLTGARVPAGSHDVQLVAQANTADQHLPNTSIDIDTPYNPYKYPGTYNPDAINFAKAQGFNADQIHVLEEGGPDRFQQTMAWIQARPETLQGVKAFADGVAYWQSHPDEIFNPLKIPGNYNPAAIQFGKDNGFSPDQLHVLQQWGPTNYNGIMSYIQKNPDQLENFKALATTVGYWETHPDMPTDPKALTNAYNPDAVKFATAQGFNEGQMKVLGSFGADNFNNTMVYISKNPGAAENFKNLANAVGYWATHMAPGSQ